MKQKFDFNSKKFFILLIIVCILFVIVVVNAFMYLPDSTKQQNISDVRANSVNRPVESTVKQSEESDDVDSKKEDKEVISKPKLEGADDIEIVDIEMPDVEKKQEKEEPKSEISEEEKADVILKEAQKMRSSKQYIKSLDEYQKLTKFSADKKILASGYDGISSLYAINKRYGTALSYAIKAYNMYPTSEREMMLARLYYKTGDIKKATQRVNNILRRDFEDDKW